MKAKAWCMIPHSKKDGIEIEMKPLTLCCECKYWKNSGTDATFWLPCQEMSTQPDWFCANGERKDEDE